MQSFIAETMSVITEALRVPARPRVDIPPDILMDQHILDVSMAEAVSDGSFIFPNPEGASEPDWCVLSHSGVEPLTDSKPFLFRGRLRAGMKPEEFVEKAYELILMRGLDATGRRTYAPTLEAHVLTKRNLLAILAKSPEARRLKAKFLIVPEPSSWLRVPPGDDSSFPPLTVRTREPSFR
jgi:hypothetical protein